MAKILIISPTPSHPQSAGNRARIFSLLSVLKNAGHEIHFVFVRVENGNEQEMLAEWDGFYTIPYKRPRLRRLKEVFDNFFIKRGKPFVLPYKIDDWYDPSISKFLIEINNKLRPDIVLIEYAYLSKAFELFNNNQLKILDTHDVMGNRHKIFYREGKRPEWFYTNVGEEKKACNRADIILSIQEKEKKYFQKITKREVITVGHFPCKNDLVKNTTTRQRNRILFVGSENKINIYGLNWFLSDVLPILKRKVPDISIDIVGKAADAIKDQEGVNRIGFADDIKTYYQRARLVVNPIQFGTGLKIKFIEALAMGCPVVSTTSGAEGIEYAGAPPFLIADSEEEFASSVHKLIINDAEYSEMVERVGVFNDIYRKTVYKPFLDLLLRPNKK